MPEPLLFRFKSRIENISPVEKTILDYAADLEFSDDAQFGLRLALDEAMSNAIIHGNQNDESKEVKVFITSEQETLKVTVCDEGNGFDRSKLVDPREEPYLHATNGRGIFLIREFVHELLFNEKGNEITFIIHRRSSCPVIQSD